MKQKSIFINASGEIKSLNELTYNNLKTFIEPITIMLLAVIVGIIIISILLPMFGIYDQMM